MLGGTRTDGFDGHGDKEVAVESSDLLETAPEFEAIDGDMGRAW